MRLNLLDMDCMGACPGLWSHPDDGTSGYASLDYWVALARLLEKGLFDSLFIADIFGVYDVYGGNADAAFRYAVEAPVNDPMLLVSAMAAATRDLGFGVTGTISYEAPYAFARRVSTLDHLSRGRFAWNIVTGYLASAARAFGLDDQLSHDERYDRADEFMAVVYKLWEGGWEDDAVLRDRRTGCFADPARIHKVHHDGRFFHMEGYHLCEPSPQRTPVLFQAGASGRGREFAARHAECVFISGLTPAMAAEASRDLRARAVRNGRQRDDLLILNGLCVITGATDREAHERYEDYRQHVHIERMLALFSGYTGVDFSGWDLDTQLTHFESNAIQTFVEIFTRLDPERHWTLREVAEFLGIGGFAPIEVGAPGTVAERMRYWMEVADLDGFNLAYVVSPGDVHRFVEDVVPELQQRGLYKRCYAPGTLREKLFGAGHVRLPANHPAAQFRNIATQDETDT